MCHVSHVLCHVSRVTCHMSNFFSFFGQGGEAYRWRVGYQRGLPCLVVSRTEVSAGQIIVINPGVKFKRPIVLYFCILWCAYLASVTNNLSCCWGVYSPPASANVLLRCNTLHTAHYSALHCTLMSWNEEQCTVLPCTTVDCTFLHSPAVGVAVAALMVSRLSLSFWTNRVTERAKNSRLSNVLLL